MLALLFINAWEERNNIWKFSRSREQAACVTHAAGSMYEYRFVVMLHVVMCYQYFIWALLVTLIDKFDQSLILQF